MDKKTVVIGASTNSDRYAYKAIVKLVENGIMVEAIGKKEGKINDIIIKKGFPKLTNIHTVSLYINPEIQKLYYNYILETKPKRVIFNPGTENFELQQMLEKNKIEWEEACTLVLLSLNKF